MRTKQIPIADLRLAKYNPRQISDHDMASLVNSKTIFICDFCDVEFKSRKACYSRMPKFCSHKCFSKSLKGKPSKSSTTFKKGHVPWCKGGHHSEETKRKISNNKQRRLKISQALIGKNLSVEHRQALSLAKKGKSIKHFIELSQRGLWKINGKSIHYGQGWRSVKRRTLSKKPFCARCGTNKNLDVHHIIPFRISKSNQIDNLEVLCRSCHRIVEHQQNLIYGILSSWILVAIMVKAELNSKRNFYCDVIRKRHGEYVAQKRTKAAD